MNALSFVFDCWPTRNTLDMQKSGFQTNTGLFELWLFSAEEPTLIECMTNLPGLIRV